MSYTATVVPDPVFESIDTMTQAEFAAWAERRAAVSDERCELLNGRVVMTPPAGYPHGLVGGRILQALAGAAAGGHWLVFDSSQGFELPSGDTVEPDVAFIARERWDAGTKPEDGEFIRIVPDLVVEILSPSTASRDRGEKKAIYERNGVREYWLVDSRARRVTRFVRIDQRFDRGTSFGESEALSSEILGGPAVAVSDLFAE